jgi:hypothetical protein
MGILSRAVPSLARRGSNDAKAEEAGSKGSAAVKEDRRKKPRTQAEEDAVREFRRLLAEMIGESPPDESDELETETSATRNEEFTEPAHATFAMNPGETAQVSGAATDAYEYAENVPNLSSATAFEEDTTDAPEEGQINSASVTEVAADLSLAMAFYEDTSDPPGEDQIYPASVTEAYETDPSSAAAFQEDPTDASEEDQINSASVTEPEPLSQSILLTPPEKQTTPGSLDSEWVRLELKDGRCLEAWRRSSPSTGQQLLILDVVTTYDSQGTEISSRPADSFIYRSEVIAINGSKIHQVQRKASTVSPSSNDQTPIEKERK